MKEEEAEKAEFDKWKDAFTVDNEGTMEDSQDESRGLLDDFVQYIKVLLQLDTIVLGLHSSNYMC